MSKPDKPYRVRFVDNEIHYIPREKIKESPHNWRVHLDPQRLALIKSFQDIGIVAPVIVRRLKNGNYELIDGHLRSELLEENGGVPCVITDLDGDESRKQITVHDPISAMAGQDTQKLSLNLKFLAKNGDELSKLVFPDYMIDPLLSANWNPGKPGEMPGREEGDQMGGHAKGVEPIELTKRERTLIQKAIAKWVKENPDDDDDTEGAVVAKICAYFLS